LGDEKVGDGKFFIAKGIVTTLHCASLKNPPKLQLNRNHEHNALANNLKKGSSCTSFPGRILKVIF
jgi:hypothetical protein